MTSAVPSLRIVLACGGTGGHLFPGLAVAEELARRGAEITLGLSPKDVDQRAVQSARVPYRRLILPVVGLAGGNHLAFARAVVQGCRVARADFRVWRPTAVMGFGGFTSVGPVLMGRWLGARTFLHESNAVPGRANRWLAPWVDQRMVGFAEGGRGWAPRVSVTGTPVRSGFRTADRVQACSQLGLDPTRPVLLVMGGSQGAQGINRLVTAALPELSRRHPMLQWIHLTGSSDQDAVARAYAAAGVPAQVHAFGSPMEQILAAATVAVSRSGASSLAEMAATRTPAVLVPYPTATDDHQRRNADIWVTAGAAVSVDQTTAGPEQLVVAVERLLNDDLRRATCREALARLDTPRAAAAIADQVEAGLRGTLQRSDNPFRSPGPAVRPLGPAVAKST